MPEPTSVATEPSTSAGSDQVQTASAAETPSTIVATPDAESGSGAESSRTTTPDWFDDDLASAADPREALQRLSKRVPREDLLKDPTFAGIVGDMAEKQAHKLIERQKADEKAAADKAEYDRLVEEGDIVSLGERELTRAQREREETAAQAAKREEDTSHAQRFLEAADANLNVLVESLEPEVLQELRALGKTEYDGDWGTGMRAWLQDVVTAHVKVQRAKWEKDVAPAMLAEALANLNGGEPSAQVNAGTPSLAGPVSQAEFDANRRDGAWRQANKGRINEGVRQRLITR